MLRLPDFAVLKVLMHVVLLHVWLLLEIVAAFPQAKAVVVGFDRVGGKKVWPEFCRAEPFGL